MDLDLQSLEEQGLALLREACCSYGIRASTEDQENYQRLWARDSIIAGIAGLLADDEKIIAGLRNSLLTLAKHQNALGMIPSNVLPNEENPDISYGSLAGRVDANSWFIIGVCLYLLNRADGNLINKLKPQMDKTLDLLDCWEYNANGLLYTPLSGNWADEYPVQGYTLYDNALRLWALRLYNSLFENEKRKQQAKVIEEKIKVNFWPTTSNLNHPAVYHQRCFKQTANGNLEHFACAINPQGYNMHFDTAGNGLALLLRLAHNRRFKKMLNHLKPIFRQISTVLMPAFWPVITSNDPLWDALKDNFNYNFKNYPHQYHNGGIWPVWMGWFALGASVTGISDLPETMLQAWLKIEDKDNISFSEYISSDTLKQNGKKRLSYSASGLIFLCKAIQKDSYKRLHLT
ncbi:glycoside hydrolase 100 family protein [Fodinibius halophilus]|uniref:beta-fructofuranosidase n=1 Tax=Fodinibius halophilus TaxID=1736908 RepID=A0A6M1T0Z0_9BACT|nr:glycoside hydrolase 100 family protein [Fodinibius halophilus]NGP89196.1 hypothetical protein [Fodinibius halophilus]